jgi:hypothetical protein
MPNILLQNTSSLDFIIDYIEFNNIGTTCNTQCVDGKCNAGSNCSYTTTQTGTHLLRIGFTNNSTTTRVCIEVIDSDNTIVRQNAAFNTTDYLDYEIVNYNGITDIVITCTDGECAPIPDPTPTATPLPTPTPTQTNPNFFDCSGCGTGYTPYNSTSCYKTTTTSSTPPVNPINLALTGNTAYSISGTSFYSSFNLDGTGNILLNSSTPSIWKNISPNNTTNGPMNRCAIWNTGATITNTWLGFSTC